MGLCYTKEYHFRQPVTAPMIIQSDISPIAKLESSFYSDIQKQYTFVRVLGHGHFGTVREAFKTGDSSKKLYAVKSIPKEKIVKEMKLLRRELQVLREVDHPNIIKCCETFEDERYVHIVMEECRGGDLFDHLIHNGQYTEQQSACLLQKIIAAINHLHSLNICHRDIKPENFLFQTQDIDSDVKIIDFGLATKFGENEEMHTVVGTPYYVAPEVLHGSYGKECDVWSLGVLLFVMLAGYPPFYGDSQNEIFKKITSEEYDFDREEWDDVSEEVRDLISGMLVVKPEKRMTLEAVLKHPWFSLFAETSTRPRVPLRILDSLKNYKAPRRLKQEAMKVIVKLLSNDEIEDLRRAFQSIDTESTGFITISELQSAMEIAGFHLASEEITSEFHAEIINKVDYLHQGRLNYTEFVLGAMDRKKFMTDEVLFNAFKYFDHENAGFITPKNLAYAFQHAGFDVDAHEVAAMIKELGLQSEDRIDFDQFRFILSTSYAVRDDTSPEKRRAYSHVPEEIAV